MVNNYYVLLFIMLFLSCKNTGTYDDSDEDIVTLEQQYIKNPVDSNFYKLIREYGDNITNYKQATKKEKMIVRAIEICNKAHKDEYKYLFAKELLKLNPEHSLNQSTIWDIGEQLLSENKPEAASVIFKGYKKNYNYLDDLHNPDKYIISEQSDLHVYISGLFSQIYINPDQQEINTNNALKFTQVCESFALVFPKDYMAPEYLFKAAEVLKLMKNYNKMITMYDWIYNYFPKYKKASLALFMKGFIIDTELAMPEEASKSYELFLKNHPNDSLVNDIKFLLKNLGKSDADILNTITKKHQTI